MVERNLYKSRSSESFFRAAIIVSAAFIFSILAGAVAGQFSNSSGMIDTSYPAVSVIEIIKSAFLSLRIFFLLFLFTFLPKAAVFELSALFLYGFSFSYSLSALVLSTDFLRLHIFWDTVLTFAVVFPASLYFCSRVISRGSSASVKVEILKFIEILVILVLILFSCKSILGLIDFLK